MDGADTVVETISEELIPRHQCGHVEGVMTDRGGAAAANSLVIACLLTGGCDCGASLQVAELPAAL